MTKAIPQIQKYMTTSPITIDASETLSLAKFRMVENDIRHLPVVLGSKIVGIISKTDIDFVQGFKGVDLEMESIKDAMTVNPYIVTTDAELDEVCRKMASDKLGSVLVEDNHKLVGIFTWVDALNAMSSLMQTRLK